jgi:hypothetical protein
MHRDHDFARSDQAHWHDWLVQRQEDGFSWLKKIFPPVFCAAGKV